MKTLLTLLIFAFLLSSCSPSITKCVSKQDRRMLKQKISTAQYFPLKQRTDIFGNKVYRAWDLNLRTKK